MYIEALVVSLFIIFSISLLSWSNITTPWLIEFPTAEWRHGFRWCFLSSTIVYLLISGWIGISASNPRRITETYPIEIYQVGSSQAVIWKEQLFNVNKLFGRTFKPDEKINVLVFDQHYAGIDWGLTYKIVDPCAPSK